MNEENPSPWPQTPDGVTDWESIFEDPKAGFIALIRSAHTPETLKDCATVVVQQLFTRDDDAMTVMKFIIDLEGILPDSSGLALTKEEIDGMRNAVGSFLRTIKEDRIERAREYLKKQAKDGERRSG